LHKVFTDKEGRAEGLLTSREKALCAARAAHEKKATGLLVLDVQKVSLLADYFLICSGATTRQTRAVAEAVQKSLAQEGAEPSHVEGTAPGRWILLDYGDLIVHIFDDETRRYYELEKLWGDARRVRLSLD
jgi:ribosome-associated protein